MNELTDIEITRAWVLSGMLNFTRYFFKKNHGKKFIIGDHHRLISGVLDRVYSGEIKRLIINIAPRYSKTELAVKNFIACGLAINPSARFIHLSYSDDLALDNSEEIKEIVKSEDYRALFPFVSIKSGSDSKKKWYTTRGGGVYATSASGQVTGFGAGTVGEEEISEIEELFNECRRSSFGGAIIIDDPIKPEDCHSKLIRERINSRFDSTIRSRVNSRDTPIIVIMQRLHLDDLCGYLLRLERDAAEGGEWHVLSLPAIIEKDGKEQALWPFKHTLPELKKLREINESVFQSQYMQHPSPSGDLAIPKSEMQFFDPSLFAFDISYYSILIIDPADRGDNFAAALAYVVNGSAYITEFICNNRGLDENIPACVDMIVRTSPSVTRIEGNGGWIQTAKDIRSGAWARNPDLDIRIFKEGANKEAKIASQAYFIRKRFFFRSDYDSIPDYRKAISAITSYIRMVKDQDDDALDVLTDISIHARRNNLINDDDESIQKKTAS